MNRMTILLLLLASFASADNAGDKDGFLHTVNRIRLDYAKKYNVPNMNELVWSQDLVHIIEKTESYGRWYENKQKWRWAPRFSYDRLASHVESDVNAFLTKNQTQRDVYRILATTHGLEFINPTQTMMGCGNVRRGSETLIICLFSPEINFWKMESDPNANCPKRYTFKNGLCSPEDPHKVSYFGFRDDFLPEVNEIRRKYAMDYQIPNMHALVWNKTLVEISGGTNWNKTEWKLDNNAWRWVRLESYRNLSIEVAEARNNWSKMDESERNEWMETNSGSYLGLELLEPKQTSIGCVPKWEGNKTFLLCLIGNQGDHDAPGSDCMKGYHNVNGLCTSTSSSSSKRRARSI